MPSQWYKYRLADRVCELCGQAFVFPECRLKSASARYCSRQCWGQAQHATSLATLPIADAVRLYHDEGLMLREVGTRLGVSTPTVTKMLRLAGRPPRRPHANHLQTPELLRKRAAAQPRGLDHHLFRDLPIAIIQEAYEAGQSTAEIAGRYGVSARLIQRRLREAGVTLRQPGTTRWCVAADGHLVQSRFELIVDDWLSGHGIAHEPQPPLPFGRRCSADFRAGEWYIEVWGITHNERYVQRRAAKLAGYREHDMRLIELFPRDITHDGCAPLRVLLD